MFWLIRSQIDCSCITVSFVHFRSLLFPFFQGECHREGKYMGSFRSFDQMNEKCLHNLNINTNLGKNTMKET